MEARILLSALPNPPVPVPPLPQGTEPLIGVVGSPLSLSPQMMRTLYGLNDIYYEYGNTVVPADGRGSDHRNCGRLRFTLHHQRRGCVR
jgi:hypothetical protein